MLSQLSTKPSKVTILLAKRDLGLTKKMSKPLVFETVGETVPIIRMYTDASYNIYKCEGRLADEIQLLSQREAFKLFKDWSDVNTIAWHSKKCKNKVRTISFERWNKADK
eukprot:GHVR01014991.1.p1 GENE.GHVR01014991.1~~GHVR01014991.1.p1  ORF type:complete len:110 (+),score=9.22 GHVR01014991.1:187-516(+)